MFRITGKKGFHIKFENGCTVSVQFGPANYCNNYNMIIGEEDELAGVNGSADAEVAGWDADGNWLCHPKFMKHDTVAPRMTPADTLEYMNWVASQPNKTCACGNELSKQDKDTGEDVCDECR